MNFFKLSTILFFFLFSNRLFARENTIAIVKGNTATIQDVWPSAPLSIASLDLVKNLRPGDERIILKEDIITRAQRAHVSVGTKNNIPQAVLVKRSFQNVSEDTLKKMIETNILEQLPAHTKIEAIWIAGGLMLPQGTIRVEVDGNITKHLKKQGLYVSIYVDDKKEESMQAVLEMSEKKSGIVLNRGDAVTILIKHGLVEIQTTGKVQTKGSIGDVISVLPDVGHKVLQASIVNDKTVEVMF